MKKRIFTPIQNIKVRDIFGVYLAILLIGYIVLNKGFAYLGVGKLYVSEIGIALGAFTFLFLWLKRELFWERLKQPAVFLLLIYMIWGLARTLPYLRTDGINALRDAVLWGYGIYSLFICLIFPRNYLEYFIKVYNRVLPFILLWLPIAFVLYWYAGFRFSLFGAPIPLLSLKSGDMGVHLGAIAAFLLLRLDKTDRPYSNWARTGLWVLWWITWLMNSAVSRSGMLSGLIGIAAILFVHPKSDWLRPAISGILVLGFFLVSGLSVHVPDPTRNVSISFNQIKINFLSLSGIGGDEIQEIQTEAPVTTSEDLRLGTMQWRLNWWKKIVNYTFKGPYFWTGKGYGINLADDDGFQVTLDHSLRSPHNVFMTILARSGVPGLVLWLAFLAALAVQAVRMIYTRPLRLERFLMAWVTIYSLILLFNACFDVFLEGPMGGIWFWSLIGAFFVLRVSSDF